jgi:hypothetical protein
MSSGVETSLTVSGYENLCFTLEHVTNRNLVTYDAINSWHHSEDDLAGLSSSVDDHILRGNNRDCRALYDSGVFDNSGCNYGAAALLEHALANSRVTVGKV